MIHAQNAEYPEILRFGILDVPAYQNPDGTYGPPVTLAGMGEDDLWEWFWNANIWAPTYWGPTGRNYYVGRYLADDPDREAITLPPPEDWEFYGEAFNFPLSGEPPHIEKDYYARDGGASLVWIQEASWKVYYIYETPMHSVTHRQIRLTDEGKRKRAGMSAPWLCLVPLMFFPLFPLLPFNPLPGAYGASTSTSTSAGRRSRRRKV